MSLLKWAWNAKSHIRAPVVDNLLYGLELDVRGLLYSGKKQLAQYPDPVLKLIPVFGTGIVADVHKLHGLQRLQAARHLIRNGSVGVHGEIEYDIISGTVKLTDDQIDDRMYYLPRADFMIQLDETEDYVVYDMVGMSYTVSNLRRFAKDNFESYRYKNSPGEKFFPSWGGGAKALRIESTDLLYRALVGKRISKDDLLGYVE